MSFQNFIVRQVMRFTIKRQMRKGTEVEPAVIRSQIDGRMKGQKWPGHVTVQEVDANGVRGLWIDTPGVDPNKVFYYLHGGGYIFGSPDTTHKDFLWRLSEYCGSRVFAIDYRKAPENPYPAAVDDAIAAYKYLLEQGCRPEGMAIGGDSAGGGLTFGSLLRMRDEGIPMPACTLGLSPWTDLTASGQSLKTNLDNDMMIPGDKIHEAAEMYLQGQDQKDTYASPLWGNHTGLPPTLIQVSSGEVLYDDSVRLADALEAAGVPVMMDPWAPALPHVFPVLARFIPEGRKALREIGIFARTHMRPVPRIAAPELPKQIETSAAE